MKCGKRAIVGKVLPTYGQHSLEYKKSALKDVGFKYRESGPP